MRHAPTITAWSRRLARAAGFAGCALLAACASRPPVPDWQAQAHGAAQRAVQASLDGSERVARQEWSRAREQVARTGDPGLLARLELLHCAVQTASVVPEACSRFEALRADAAAPEQAYAAYLAGQPLAAGAVALLPPAQQAVARAAPGQADAQVAALADPLAQLVAAGVLLRRGQLTPHLAQTAVDTASRQGWRRPLLAWLGVQLRLAEQGGEAQQAAHVRRRMDVVEQGGRP